MTSKAKKPKRKTKCRYMHLLDGRPAYFCPKERQLFFVFNSNNIRLDQLLVGSLKEIREQQRLDEEWVKSTGNKRDYTYHYLRVKG